MHTVIMLSAVSYVSYAEYLYAECHCADCCGAKQASASLFEMTVSTGAIVLALYVTTAKCLQCKSIVLCSPSHTNRYWIQVELNVYLITRLKMTNFSSVSG